MDDIKDYEHHLLIYATEELQKIKGVKIYGTAKNKTAVISFNIQGIHPYDMGTLLDKDWALQCALGIIVPNL